MNQTKQNQMNIKINQNQDDKIRNGCSDFFCPGFSNLTLQALTRCLRRRRENWSKTIKWGNMVNFDDPAWIHNSIWTFSYLSTLYHFHFYKPSEGPKNHRNLKILVSKFVPRGFEAWRTWGFEAQRHGVSRGGALIKHFSDLSFCAVPRGPIWLPGTSRDIAKW